MKFVYPKLSPADFWVFRLFGPGLGNLLFPWARATVLALHSDFKLISPTWPQFKIGTLLRRELDARHYAGLFTAPPGSLNGVARLRQLAFARRVDEKDAALAVDGNVVEVSGMDGMFEPLRGHHIAVRAALIQMTKQEHQQGLRHDFAHSISIHVRMGDFTVPTSAEDVSKGTLNMRVPLSWYTGIVNGIRARHGQHIRVHVFSDGTDEELQPLLALENCQRLGFGNAIADLLALSNSSMLIASGSTFSMWASYLGRMPVIWHPGQKKQSLYGERGPMETEMARFE